MGVKYVIVKNFQGGAKRTRGKVSRNTFYGEPAQNKFRYIKIHHRAPKHGEKNKLKEKP